MTTIHTLTIHQRPAGKAARAACLVLPELPMPPSRPQPAATKQVDHRLGLRIRSEEGVGEHGAHA